MLELQQVGKSPALCASGSAFESLLGACNNCLVANGGLNGTYAFIRQFIGNFYEGSFSFCSAQQVPLLTSISCPAYPSSLITSAVSVVAVMSNTTPVASQSTPATTSSYAAVTSYPYGFWLQYNFTVCPTRTANPTFTYPASCLPTDYIWGCPPSYQCTPAQVNCDLEVGPPSTDYVCDPKDCLPAPPVPLEPNLNITNNITIFSPYPLPTGYFNLNPVIFGLDWGIFTGNVSVTSFSSAGISTPSNTATTSTPSLTPTPQPPARIQHSSRAWIAGPTVGSVCGIAILVFAITYFLRRRKSKSTNVEGPIEKAQLDGEGIKPKELSPNETRELEGHQIVPIEMDAGYHGAEMEVARGND